MRHGDDPDGLWCALLLMRASGATLARRGGRLRVARGTMGFEAFADLRWDYLEAHAEIVRALFTEVVDTTETVTSGAGTA